MGEVSFAIEENYSIVENYSVVRKNGAGHESQWKRYLRWTL
jgi:hypothetical protein